MVETDINKRWEDGTAHHPESYKLFRSLEEIDLKHGGDYFCWKSGGDGDNGEHFMYELDIHFETLEQKNIGLYESLIEELYDLPNTKTAIHHIQKKITKLMLEQETR